MAASAAKHGHKHMVSTCTRFRAHTAHGKLARAALTLAHTG